MTDTVRCWLVERSLDDGRIITTRYATPDGANEVTRQRAMGRDPEGVPVSIEVETSDLTPVDDDDMREQYHGEVTRVREEHDASDTV